MTFWIRTKYGSIPAGSDGGVLSPGPVQGSPEVPRGGPSDINPRTLEAPPPVRGRGVREPKPTGRAVSDAWVRPSPSLDGERYVHNTASGDGVKMRTGSSLRFKTVRVTGSQANRQANVYWHLAVRDEVDAVHVPIPLSSKGTQPPPPPAPRLDRVGAGRGLVTASGRSRAEVGVGLGRSCLRLAAWGMGPS